MDNKNELKLQKLVNIFKQIRVLKNVTHAVLS